MLTGRAGISFYAHAGRMIGEIERIERIVRAA
jgi:hypothetical protein